MMLLYNVQFTRHTELKLHYLSTVKAVQADLAGHCYGGTLVKPDLQAIADAMPTQWRKAFAKVNSFVFTSCDGAANQLQYACYATLRDYRGNRLGTIYATPYEVQS
jgi:hypothetical protein